MGPRPRRRLRGSVAQPPGRGARAAAARTWPSSTTRSRRRATCAATSSSCAATSCASTWRRCASARSRRRSSDGELHELVIRHELQHTETMLQTMALAGLDAAGVRRPAPRVRHRAGAGRGARGAGRDRRRRRRASPTTTSARATRELPDASRSAARRSPTPTWLRSPRAAATSAASGGRDEGWAWKQEYDITHHAAAEAGDPDAPSSTSPGSRPTPSPARTMRACRRSSSGRRRRPGASSRASAKCGSGPRARSRATPGSSPTRIGSTPKCSSATATGCCAAVRAPRIRGSPRRTSATGTSPQRRQLFAGVRIAR